MIRRFLPTLLLCNLVFGIWPFPSGTFNSGSGSLVLSSTFTFNTTSHSAILQAATNRYLGYIFDKCQSFDEMISGDVLGDLVITVLQQDETLSASTDESYELNISASGSTIQATTVFGALHALETFSQLIQCTDTSRVIMFTPVSITDAPRFKHRGLLIDSSRHFLPVQTILNTIDALATNKMNVLHWHISDAESFPMESKKYPGLTKGAYTSKLTYSQMDAAMIVKYGLFRGVRVIPEFDTPGHTNSWQVGMPNIVSQCPNFGRNINNVNLNPTIPQTAEVVSGFWGEMNSIFTDTYIHIGGDEVEYGCWQEDAQINNWMSQHGVTSYNQLMQMYETQLWNNLASSGKSLIAWEEVFNGYNLNVPNNITIEVWKDENTLLDVASAGLNGILAYGWYLDHLTLTWQNFYTHEPFTSGQWTPALEAKIIGGEACMWGEQVDGFNFESRVWPRASATAERLWSPESVNDPVTAQPRLVDFICHMNSRGIAAGPIAPGFCQ